MTGHADEVARLLEGYAQPQMPTPPDPDDTGALRAIQDERAHEEADQARTAHAPDEALAHARRAEKAAYLRDRLAEADEALADDRG